MNASFGIDHPLLATRDIGALRNRLIALGFTMTAIGQHPWGTSTSLAMFDGCLLEIMGIYDDSLLDEVPAGAFRFGRHIHAYLQKREGVALSALHSTDSVEDAARAAKEGFEVAGHLEFGRHVILPDGTAGRTKTTLALLPDPVFPRLSFFLCQQHRPEFIYVPAWLTHENTATGIGGVTVLADTGDQAALRVKLTGIYGEPAAINGGFAVPTANGPMRVQDYAAVTAAFGSLPADIYDDGPCIVAMDILVKNTATMRDFLVQGGFAYCEVPGGYQLIDPTLTANTYLRFVQAG
jgi:hypothetical protein